MPRALFILLLLICSLARASERVALEKAPGLRYSIAATVPGRLVVRVENAATAACLLRVERGTVFVGGTDHAKLITLRSAELALAAKSSGEMSIPAAALSTGELSREQTFAVSPETIPALGALLDYCQSHDNVPGPTAQLLVLCVQEDISFAKWKDFAARQPSPDKTSNTSALDEVVAAIDAIGVLRAVYPQRAFALASDPELKLRALRNPLARGKAMQLYGIDLPEAPLPPELGTLLHTKPGDNCPICRQRALMQPREDGL